jgi:putative ATPase
MVRHCADWSRRTPPHRSSSGGPPGIGKSTIAHIIAHTTQRNFIELSATSATVRDVRRAIAEAAEIQDVDGIGTVLFIDEVHRFTKAQQDSLLHAVEDRIVTLVAATTENPAFSVIAPLLSRSLLLTLEPLTKDDVALLIERAMVSPKGLDSQYALTDGALEDLVLLSAGDARRALTYLEEVTAAASSQGLAEVTSELVLATVNRAVARYDRDGDQHYDIISAFIKSLRGSDVNAALHWLARMVDAGEKPEYIARRLVVHASEDVGMADPTALLTAVAAAQAVALIGMPEAGINLAHATIAVASASKSNAVIVGYNRALADVRAGITGSVPMHLRDSHYASAEEYGHGLGYKYPHDYPGNVVEQQYLPLPLGTTSREIGDGPGPYYQPTLNGFEANVTAKLVRDKIQMIGNRLVDETAHQEESP